MLKREKSERLQPMLADDCAYGLLEPVAVLEERPFVEPLMTLSRVVPLDSVIGVEDFIP